MQIHSSRSFCLFCPLLYSQWLESVWHSVGAFSVKKKKKEKERKERIRGRGKGERKLRDVLRERGGGEETEESVCVPSKLRVALLFPAGLTLLKPVNFFFPFSYLIFTIKNVNTYFYYY